MRLFRERVAALFSTRLVDDESVPLETLTVMVNEGLAVQHMFGTNEAKQAAQSMSDAGDILLSDAIVYKI